MLSTLRIQNLAIVESLEIEFLHGLNVLTGETGAGKSIILKAIELLCGRRAGPDLVRTGADRCTIEGMFELTEAAKSLVIAESPELADDLEGDELLIRRVVDRSGKSKFSLNGQLTTSSLVQRISPTLIDITGQHQQQTLLDPDRHLAVLDSAGVPEALREETAALYRKWNDAQRALDRFLHDEGARAAHIERISAEQQELLEAGVRVGLRQELEAEMTRLSSVEHLSGVLNRALTLLEEGDENVHTMVRTLSGVLHDGLRYDPALGAPVELVDTAAVHLAEAKIALDEYGSRLEADPSRLEELRAQISVLARLERKYNRREEELVHYLEEISTELQSIARGEQSETHLRAALTAATAELRAAEKKLSQCRQKVASSLSKAVQSGLRELGMKRAEFSIPVTVAPSSATGADGVQFLLTANPGEPPRPIDKVASGGELSRILLVLKTTLNERNGALTQIFDEVDTGISGAVSQIVGGRLAEVARHAQVILVTHSPQVAAFADAHFVIAKNTKKDRTATTVELLERSGRIAQLAAMLGGKQTSKSFEQSAAELIRVAEFDRNSTR